MTNLEIFNLVKNNVEKLEKYYRDEGLNTEADLLANLTIKGTNDATLVDTMAVNYLKFILWFNYNFVNNIKQNELYFILLHELQHLIFNSFERVQKWVKEVEEKTKNKKYVNYPLLANICEDALINGMLRYNYISYKIDGSIFGNELSKNFIYPNTLALYADSKLKKKFQHELNWLLKKNSHITLESDLLYTVIDTPQLMGILIKVLPEKNIVKLQNQNKNKINMPADSKSGENSKDSDNNDSDNKDGNNSSNKKQDNTKKTEETNDKLKSEYNGKQDPRRKTQSKNKKENSSKNADKKDNKEKKEVFHVDKGKDDTEVYKTKKLKGEPYLSDILKKYLINYTKKQNRSYSKYNRKNSVYSTIYNSRLVLPGYTKSKKQELKDAILYVDVSGSINDKQREVTLNNIYHLLKQFKSSSYYLHVVTWSDGLISFDSYNKSTKREQLKLVGTGGNDTTEMFSENIVKHLNTMKGKHKILKKDTKFEYCFILTDGYVGDVNVKTDIYKNVIWILPKENLTKYFIKSEQLKQLMSAPRAKVEVLENY